MTEITVQLHDPAHYIRQLRHAGELWADPRLTALADLIEEQVKPAIEEPIAFGSVVLAFTCGHDPMQWVRTSPPEYSQWTNRDGYTVPWQKLCEAEVLRVGIGETDEGAEGEAFKAGVRNTVARGINVLEGFRDQALTAERKDAYQNAINVLRELS